MRSSGSEKDTAPYTRPSAPRWGNRFPAYHDSAAIHRSRRLPMKRPIPLAVVVLGIAASLGYAQDKPAAPADNAKAAEIVKQAAAHLRGLKAYSFDFSSVSLMTAE